MVLRAGQSLLKRIGIRLHLEVPGFDEAGDLGQNEVYVPSLLTE
ncbi:MAG TPA: hypothetical protein PKA76_16140 [Pirellulaceae bacterium]|nr:hypothetical protein [Pirellulaceae bacterium]